MDEEGERVVWKGEINEVRMRMRGRKWKRKYMKRSSKRKRKSQAIRVCVCGHTGRGLRWKSDNTCGTR